MWIRTYKDKGKGKGKDVPLGVDPDHFWRQHQTNFRGSYLGDDEAEQVTYPAQDLERMGRIQESSYKVGRLVESQIHFLVYIYIIIIIKSAVMCVHVVPNLRIIGQMQAVVMVMSLSLSSRI